MGKLKTPLSAGFNAGKTYYAKTMRTEDIVIDPEISNIFSINEHILEEIYQNMLVYGFDPGHPVFIQKDTNILLDGHTRTAAAIKAGITEIPVVEKDFESKDEAFLHILAWQALRRNLKNSEVLAATTLILGRKKKDGTGSAAEHLAKQLKLSVATIYQAKALVKNAPEEILQKVKSGDMSIKKGYNEMVNPSKDREEPKIVNISGISGLPSSAKFLQAAVIHLVEQEQEPAATMLINHFLKKKERDTFLKALPKTVVELLDNPFATPGIVNSPQRQDKEAIYDD